MVITCYCRSQWNHPKPSSRLVELPYHTQPINPLLPVTCIAFTRVKHHSLCHQLCWYTLWCTVKLFVTVDSVVRLINRWQPWTMKSSSRERCSQACQYCLHGFGSWQWWLGYLSHYIVIVFVTTGNIPTVDMKLITCNCIRFYWKVMVLSLFCALKIHLLI